MCDCKMLVEIKKELEEHSKLKARWAIRSMDDSFRIYPDCYFAAKVIKKLLLEKKIKFRAFCEKRLRPKLFFARGFDSKMTEQDDGDGFLDQIGCKRRRMDACSEIKHESRAVERDAIEAIQTLSLEKDSFPRVIPSYDPTPLGGGGFWGIVVR